MRLRIKQQGFTLLELMISLVLGLLVSAIALQLFFTSQKSATVQQGMMNLQNSSLFGLGGMIDSIRLANLNSSQPYIDDKVLYGGIVLSANNISNNLGNGTSNFKIETNLLTRGGIGESNLDGQKSDQLVIQYRVNTANQFDCEGKELTAIDYVVERYFLLEDKNKNDPNKPLALACKAARYTEATAKTNTSLPELAGDEENKGAIVIPRVDHFSVRLGVAYDGANSDCTGITQTIKDKDGKDVKSNTKPDSQLDCFSYMNIEDYRALTGEKPQIVSVQLGLLVRSTDTTGNNKFFDLDHPYHILNVNGKLTKNDRNSLYLRSVVTQTIALRNGFGVE
ncbi:PilW family protein [Acinetobacter sp. AG3]|jgi:type IV pilus assembly protein PilW|uniref:PilW family protein n=1 Tax=unclassified Acinetobacter TaxID=196816 RepID=UPI001EF0B174|nr:PilW family protein [Acinetobacter sp. AG3]MCG7222648.1 PilW family protein [Acinetobacter sp. AG3]